MAEPTTVAMEMLKRTGRYLKEAPRLAQEFEKQSLTHNLDGLSDSDHAGCLRTRRSTSCSVLKYGKHTLKMSSTTQVPIAISSGESEWYAAVKTTSMLIGAVAMSKDLGRTVQPRLWLDSTASKGIASRRGCGKVRHLETTTLWVQRFVTNKVLTIHKILGTLNDADLGTKHVDRQMMLSHLARLGYVFLEGRHKSAKAVIT